MSVDLQDMRLPYGHSDSLSVTVYKGSDYCFDRPLVLYIHGGAFLDKNVGVDRPVATALAEAGAVVFACDYSSTASQFPNSLDVALSMLRHIALRRTKFGSRSSMLLIAGEESGGNIAAGLALRVRDQMPGLLAGQILMSPLLDPFMSSYSMRNANDLGMRDSWTSGWVAYLAHCSDASHPYVAPSRCSRLSGSVPSLIVTSKDDPLQDEVIEYANKLTAAGAMVSRHLIPADRGWPNIYGAQTRSPPCWTEDLKSCFQAFWKDLRDSNQDKRPRTDQPQAADGAI